MSVVVSVDDFVSLVCCVASVEVSVIASCSDRCVSVLVDSCCVYDGSAVDSYVVSDVVSVLLDLEVRYCPWCWSWWSC